MPASDHSQSGAVRVQWHRGAGVPDSSGAVAVITLDRADRRNALTPKMLTDLEAALGCVEDRHAGCVVLGGEGRVFCAGFDLGLCAQDPGGGTLDALLTGLSRVVRAMRGLGVPVVVAAHGAAIAGGCALLGGADVVVTDSGAKLGYPVAKLGISPAVSAPFLGADLPAGVARALMLDPGLIGAERAKAIGLVHEVVADREMVGQRAIDLAERLVWGTGWRSLRGLEATKRWLMELGQMGDAGTGVGPEAGLGVSRSLVGSSESRERIGLAWGGAVDDAGGDGPEPIGDAGRRRS